MTPKKVALYLVGGSALVAWFAAAAGVDQSFELPVVPKPVQTSGTESLAEEVQAQGARLRGRLAAAPSPQQPPRNPFAFAPPPAMRAPRPAPLRVPSTAPAPIVSEPALSLIGLAEDSTPQGPVRTAIISAEGGELFMLKVGELMGARYRVQAIGPDAVELADLTSGALRRLALKK